MKLFLLIFLAILGLLNSFSTFFKEKKSTEKSWSSKFRWDNIGAALYILAFFVSLSVVVMEENDDKKQEAKNEKILTNVENIDKTVSRQEDTLSNIINSTEEIKRQFIKVEQKTIDAIREREKSLEEFNKISKELSKQVKLEKLNLSADAPIVTVISEDVVLFKKDSNQYNLLIRFKNLGNRPAKNLQSEIATLVLNKENEIIGHVLIPPSNNTNQYLFPSKQDGHFVASVVTGFNKSQVENKDHRLIVLINYKYYDELLNTFKSDFSNFRYDADFSKKGFSKYEHIETIKIKEYLKKYNLEKLFEQNLKK